MIKNLKEKYNPLYFLTSLGAGGLAVSFFIYLQFLIPHKDTPIVTFNHLLPYFNNPEPLTGLVVLSMLGIIVFAYFHISLLIWNTKEYFIWKKTEKYNDILNSNAEVTLMVLPLAFSMLINVMFAVGAVFVPNLWLFVEYLFPFAIVGFLINGLFAIKFFLRYVGRLIIKGNFDFDNNNNLGQLISIFSFTMVAVGLSASSAMSHTKEIAIIATILSIFFVIIALTILFIKIILGIKSIMSKGINASMSATLWVMIPILTLLGITFIRVYHGLSHNIGEPTHINGTIMFVFTTAILSFQLLIGLVGYYVMKEVNYFKEYIHGDKTNANTPALICPGVALMVFGMFFVHVGLVQNGIVDKYSMVYFFILMPFVYIQIITIKTYFILKRKLLNGN